jgi:hypothetical protein
MLTVLLPPNRDGASIQRQYIDSGNFDFCIDDGKRVGQLTNDTSGWPNIEAGTKIVMRVVLEQTTEFSRTYACHLCGTSNDLMSFGKMKEWLTDGSIDWFVPGIR